jgi:DNA-binding transcriptional ArsR family regulator
MRAEPTRVLKALADPTRRALFERLCRTGELSVRTLTDSSGVSQPAVSKHLGILRAAGLVQDRQSGRETLYSARAAGIAPLMNWLTQYTAYWESRFDKLERLLQRMDC